MKTRPEFTVRRLAWSDEEVGSIALPERPLRIVMGFGSGLSSPRNDPPGTIWAVGDRGPNVKPKTLVKRYGLNAMRDLEGISGAKIMPRPDLGPAIAKLQLGEHRVELLEVVKLSDAAGIPISGLPPASGLHGECERAFDLTGEALRSDPSGLDSEGIIACADGSFWVADEFGPSLVRLDAQGQVQFRYVPEGVTLESASYPVEARLPAIAACRQLNRGFEAIALSPDERWLYLAFQGPLAHPDEAAHKQARHVRVWRLDAATLEVTGQYLYPLDHPDTFLRDLAHGPLAVNELKISEIACLGDERLLILERGSQTTKICLVVLDDAYRLSAEHLELGSRPTVEELSAGKSFALPELPKEAIFSSDDAPEVGADLEGMVVLSSTELLLVNDNDFGVEGVETGFWIIRFDDPVLQ